MRALLVHKKQAYGRTFWRFERRDMGCFNGFNRIDAFAPVQLQESFHRTHLCVVEIARNNAVVVTDRDIVGDSNGWSLVAIGWMSDVVKPTYKNWSPINDVLQDNHIINREWSSPSERELATVIEKIRGSVSHSVHPILDVFILNNSSRYTLFDLIGKERSSGFAVSYLQIYRNICNGLENKGYLFVSGVEKIIFDSDGGAKVRHPLVFLSLLFNNGSDSDILSFSGDIAINQAAAHGIETLQPFFRNTRPMEREGRYSKGEQSSTLLANIRTECDRRVLEYNHSDDVITGAYGLANRLQIYLGTLNGFMDNILKDLMERGNTTRAVSNYLANLGMPLNIHSVINQLVKTPNVPDLSAPINTEQLVEQNMANGFVQWASTHNTIETE